MAYVRFNLVINFSGNLFVVLNMVVSKNLKIWLLLVLLTILAVTTSSSSNNYSVLLLLSLAFVKFLGVSFYYMEIRKAHLIYKTVLIIFGILLFSILLILF